MGTCFMGTDMRKMKTVLEVNVVMVAQLCK